MRLCQSPPRLDRRRTVALQSAWRLDLIKFAAMAARTSWVNWRRVCRKVGPTTLTRTGPACRLASLISAWSRGDSLRDVRRVDSRHTCGILP